MGLTSIDRDNLRRQVAKLVEGKSQVGASAVARDHFNRRRELPNPAAVPEASKGDCARALRELGWVANGHVDCGYDRETRYVAPLQRG